MFDIAAFLDRAKAGAGDVSDYRLAQLIGVSQPTISLYRSGRRLPEPGVVLRLCDYSGDDPEHVVACVQSMRAANDPVEAEMWQRMAARLRRSSLSIAAAAVALAAVSSAGGMTTEAQAGPLPHDAAEGLRIMSTLLLSWMMYLSVSRGWRFPKARAPLTCVRLSPSGHRA